MLEGDAFAHATFADNGRGLSLVNGKIDLVQDGSLSEPFGHIHEFYQRRGHGLLIWFFFLSRLSAR